MNEEKNQQNTSQEEPPKEDTSQEESVASPTPEAPVSEEVGQADVSQQDTASEKTPEEIVQNLQDEIDKQEDALAQTTALGLSTTKWVLAGLALVAILAGTGYGLGWYSLPGTNTAQNATEPVARINGEVITQGELQTNIDRQSAIAQSQGTQAQSQEAVLEQMVNRELLLQDAANKDIIATDEEISTQIDNLTSQLGGQASLDEALSQQGLNQEELREGIYDQLVLDKYQDVIIEEQNITATNEEVQQLYNQAAQNQPSLPALEQVRDQVASQVVQQKLQVALQEIISLLREAADIEVLL